MVDEIQDYYNRWTSVYDSFATNPIVQRWRKNAVEHLEIKDGNTVVDIGCGTGANTGVIHNNTSDETRIVCVDISDSPLRMIRHKIDEYEWHNIHTVRADGKRLPMRDFDRCIATFSVGMFPNPVRAADHWMSMLNDGGRFCMLNVVRSSNDTALNRPISAFTAMTTPGTTTREKLDLSMSGDALDSLTNKIHNVEQYLRDNYNIVDKERFLGGTVELVVAEV